MSTTSERNQDILARYKAGASCTMLARRFRVSRARIYQILAALGAEPRARDQKAFIGLKIPAGSRSALQARAKEKDMTVTALVNQAIDGILEEDK